MSGTDGLPSTSANDSVSMDSDVARRFCQENRDLCEICGLLAYNKTYIELLDELIAKVDDAVVQNRSAQTVIKQKLSRPSGRSRLRRRQQDFGLQYWYPYFRDANGMVPAQNEETLALSRVCSVNPLMEEDKKWKERDLETLKKAVSQSLNEQQIIALEAKKDVVSRRLRAAGVETTDEQMESWREELERIKTRIKYIRDRPADEVIQEANSDFSLVDWAKISASVFQGSRSIIQLKQKWHCDVMFDQGPWTVEEDQSLLSVAADFSNWDVIAQLLNTGRSAFRCFERHIYLQGELKEKRAWTPEEDNKLLIYVQLFKVGEQIPWAKISIYMEGRSKQACELRYTRSLNEALRHGRWSETEDMLLLRAINKYGPQNWSKISHCVPGRSTLQCRDRWIHVLDHKRRDLPWGWEEHQRLLYGISLFGRNECAKIAKLLPGRNNMDVRMRVRLLVKYKIEETINPKKNVVFRHFADNYICCKRRRTSVIEKFQDYLETERHDRKSQLHARLGFGTYMAESVDYTDIKKERLEEFGRWIVTGSGRWIRVLQKNPNEYDGEDLMAELNKLPPEVSEEAIEWIRESDERLDHERQTEKTIPDDPVEAMDFYEKMYPKERLEELSELVGKLLKPTPDDITYYNRHKRRPPKLQLKKDKSLLQRIARQKRKARRKTKLAKLLSPDCENVEDIDILGLKWSDRMLLEVNRIINEFPKRERRGYLLRSLCNAIRQRIHHLNISLLKSDSSFRNKTTKFIHDYVEKVIDDLPAPIPLKPGDRVDESTNAVLLPQNWHNLSLKELMQFKIAPNIYPELVQQARAESQLLTVVVHQEEDPSLKWSKRRRLEEPAHGFKGRFKETVVYPMPENQTGELQQQAALYGKILTKLVPPCPATINAIELLEAKIRRLLLNCSLEPSLTRKCGDNGPETASTSANLPTVGSFAASSLFQRCIVPENVRHSSDYALLRKRIFRLFFLPLLMRRAIKTNEDEDGSVELT